MASQEAEFSPPRRALRAFVIAADVDGTLISTHDEHGEEFAAMLAPQLVEVVRLGAHVVLISGNSVERLVPRLIAPLVHELCCQHALPLLSRFLWAFSSGGVLAHVSPADLATLLEHRDDDAQPARVLEWMCPTDVAGRRRLRSSIISTAHVNLCRLEPDPRWRARTEATVEQILRDVGDLYYAKLLAEPALRAGHDLTLVSDDDGRLVAPLVDVRRILHAEDSSPAVMQMTLRPLLNDGMRPLRPEPTVPDLRTRATVEVQRRLDHAGLGHLAAREAGRSSIDVGPRHIDKALAMRSVLDFLDVSAAASCYVGDEVFAGNDRPLLSVPGLTVIAVDGCGDGAPLPTGACIVTPPPTLSGPRASSHVLRTFLEVAEHEIQRAAGTPADLARRSAIALVLERLVGRSGGWTATGAGCATGSAHSPRAAPLRSARAEDLSRRRPTLPRQPAGGPAASAVLNLAVASAPARAPPSRLRTA
jgi:hypothetical protein